MTATADAAANFLGVPTNPAEELKQELTEAIVGWERSRPRSLQTAIGPSEVGTECVRKLAYKLAGFQQFNFLPDPWPTIQGTALHSVFEEAFGGQPDRWLVETEVHVTRTLKGKCDLYDVQRARVIDHKTAGATGMQRYRGHGPKMQQIVQLGLYALGMENTGRPVREVALAFYPLGGQMRGLYTWVAPYDTPLAEAGSPVEGVDAGVTVRQLALDALTRFDNIRALVAELDIEHDPTRISLVPASPSKLCEWCDHWRRGSQSLTQGCPGQAS